VINSRDVGNLRLFPDSPAKAREENQLVPEKLVQDQLVPLKQVQDQLVPEKQVQDQLVPQKLVEEKPTMVTKTILEPGGDYFLGNNDNASKVVISPLYFFYISSSYRDSLTRLSTQFTVHTCKRAAVGYPKLLPFFSIYW
jgi:hypothetical protein